MNSNKESLDKGEKPASPTIPPSTITNGLKEVGDKKTNKISIDKVFMLNDAHFAKGINPVSGNLTQLQNSKTIIINKAIPSIEKKNIDTGTTTSIGTVGNSVQSIVQLNVPLGVQNSPKIILNSTPAITDVKVLQQILASLTGAKNQRTVLLKSVPDGKSYIIHSDQLNSICGSDKKNVPNVPVQDHSQNKKALQPNEIESTGRKIAAVQNGQRKNDDTEKQDEVIFVKKTHCGTDKNTVSTPGVSKADKNVSKIFDTSNANQNVTQSLGTSDVVKNVTKTIGTPQASKDISKTISTRNIGQNVVKLLGVPSTDEKVAETSAVPNSDKKISKNFNTSDAENIEAKTTGTPKRENTLVKPPSVESPAKQNEKRHKKKRYMYRLKGKNGRVLSYISDSPIVLKRPLICLDKMTEADAERLSKQFAKESGRKPRKKTKTVGNKTYPTRASLLSKQSETPNASTSFAPGIQTRKRQLKFLPDGRVVKTDKKSRRPSFSSTSLSSMSDEERKLDTSDESYSDSSIKKSDRKKPSIVKKVTVEKKVESSTTNLANKSIPSTQNKKSPKADPPVNTVSKPAAPSTLPQGIKSVGEPIPQQKIQIDPAKLLSTFIGVQISSSQLTVNRFKPKNLASKGTDGATFTTKKVIVTNSVTANQSAGMSKVLSSANTVYKISSKPVFSEPPPLSPLTPMTKQVKNISNKSTQSLCTVNDPTQVIKPLVKKDLLQDILVNFESFTDTKIVKTKQGPKKLIFSKLSNDDDQRTIYDVMDEVFEAMPSWNIHVIPETKSFCLAQISRSRTGIPALKKSIEIDSEFAAKVYVHQLHCKRYDGVYDTENKIKKLIRDIDALIV